ncbi:MAG: UDP-N-acetylmuramate dehydrogenase [Oscillospiraceae bacterium]
MLKEFFMENDIDFLERESLKNHTTFKVGGDADYIVMPKTVEQVMVLLKLFKSENVPYYVLGRGSNVIFKDCGFKGVIIKTSGLQSVWVEGTTVTAQAGVTLNTLCKRLQENQLSGLEFCYGIPGNVGGATYMNAGAYGGEICDAIIEIEYIDENVTRQTIGIKQGEFSYRHSIFQEKNWLITACKFSLKKADGDKILQFMEEIMDKRRDKQPLDKPSAGSSFKRPQGHFAAALIDECGLKGKTCGGAQISEKHAGFIVNIGKATCCDIQELATQVENIVLEKTGVKLEREMIIV